MRAFGLRSHTPKNANAGHNLSEQQPTIATSPSVAPSAAPPQPQQLNDQPLTYEPGIMLLKKKKAMHTPIFELSCHTAILGKTGSGKTHLACHLIMEWASLKG